MPRFPACAVLAALSIAVTAHAGTSFVTQWRAPDVQPGTLHGQRVIAVFESAEEGLRRGIEQTLAMELTKLGVQGVPAYTLVATEDIKDESKVRAKFEEAGASGAVVMRLAGRDQEITAAPAMYYAAPNYAGFYGGYWGWGFGGVYDPGYVRTDRLLYVETLVYSLKQNKLVWAGTSKTKNAKDANKLVRELVGKVASDMKKEGLLR